ncbi:unnamed protein product (macronuclear) [Paramecium tetraurelia]|uniref:Uncharacterized protein n=1 Tax=Paramecium tetraurelia TaxID=5888 RepID=A0BFE3_PARTE|nr:uncharacterized protein GSPATT00028295001 [Paramecium tetraurelia]CAK57260.1 unnamed protein product [Paramecium tetraurelia]|eukprot:XP_001424658.1 hypothetical protein (macronuclear) [Paramecium tetraurelia strain d4-2]
MTTVQIRCLRVFSQSQKEFSHFHIIIRSIILCCFELFLPRISYNNPVNEGPLLLEIIKSSGRVERHSHLEVTNINGFGTQQLIARGLKARNTMNLAQLHQCYLVLEVKRQGNEMSHNDGLENQKDKQMHI